ncbi:MAG: glutathione S-transferase family protein [Aquabacterium sp.]|nr:MAG: glutathione S-transferase family protein [Aquabacterium sp.]
MSAAPQLELVSHKLCPYVQRAAIVLAEKGAPFKRTDIDLADKPQWFRQISPLGKVPLLRVQQPGSAEAVVFESAVIVEYLEDTLLPSLHPKDALQRAQHRAWMEFGSALLMDIWGLETERSEEGFEAKRLAARGKLERLDAALGARERGGPYFGGPSFSMVDAVFAPAFRYWEVFDRIADLGSFDGLDRVQAWRAALAQRASVRQAVGPDYADLLLAFIRDQKGWLASSSRALAT